MTQTGMRLVNTVFVEDETAASDDKLAVLSRLVNGMAHKLRNSLTVIDARVQFLVPMADRDPAIARHLTPLVEEVERVKALVQSLSAS
jgi:signal transduction histidine kinase